MKLSETLALMMAVALLGVARTQDEPAAGRVGDPPNVVKPAVAPKTVSFPLKPSEKLGMPEWLALMRELGYDDNLDTPQVFYDRLTAWDESHSDQTAASESPSGEDARLDLELPPAHQS